MKSKYRITFHDGPEVKQEVERRSVIKFLKNLMR